jgi:hypothetical protein
VKKRRKKNFADSLLLSVYLTALIFMNKNWENSRNVFLSEQSPQFQEIWKETQEQLDEYVV